MGFGKAGGVDPKELGAEFPEILGDSEEALRTYKSARDYLVFTDVRLVWVDKLRLTDRKVEYHSIPHRSITHFSVESAGSLDRDANLKV